MAFVACLDTGRCFRCGAESLEEIIAEAGEQGGGSPTPESPDVTAVFPKLSSYPREGIAYEQGTNDSIVMLQREELESLLSISFTSALLFARQRHLNDRSYWSFPPPVSPSQPFGSLPAACERCRAAIEGHCPYDRLLIRSLGIVDGVDAGRGLFARGSLNVGEILGEYTGVVVERETADDDPLDEYQYQLPMIEPDLVISAKTRGNLCRLINHSDEKWNAEFVSVHHHGMVHVICRVVRNILVGEQVLVHYGSRYWEKPHRTKIELL